jgi:hypothetical protein
MYFPVDFGKCDGFGYGDFRTQVGDVGGLGQWALGWGLDGADGAWGFWYPLTRFQESGEVVDWSEVNEVPWM